MPDNMNAVLTALAVASGVGGVGGAIDAKMDAGNNADKIEAVQAVYREQMEKQQSSLQEWNKAISLRIGELEKQVADLKGYIRGVETGEKSCKP